jgi:hypothetical protein
MMVLIRSCHYLLDKIKRKELLQQLNIMAHVLIPYYMFRDQGC